MRLGRVAHATDTGRKRRRNEDAFVVRPPLFAVADGMGGAPAGQTASRLATEALDDEPGSGSGEERVAALMQAANQRVYERSSADVASSGMGTTMTLALVEDAGVSIGHVGDSRAYRIRDGQLEQLTEDHSLVGELIRSGKLSREEGEAHPQRSVITRALGTDPDVDADIVRLDARPGDVFLLCSDGLTDKVDDETILSTVQESGDLERAARQLVALANRGGGEDNITVVCFEIAEDAAEATAPLPPPEEAAADDDEEDTLSELDAIPTLDAPAAPSRRPLALRLLVAVLVLVVAALALLLAWGLLR